MRRMVFDAIFSASIGLTFPPARTKPAAKPAANASSQCRAADQTITDHVHLAPGFIGPRPPAVQRKVFVNRPTLLQKRPAARPRPSRENGVPSLTRGVHHENGVRMARCREARCASEGMRGPSPYGPPAFPRLRNGLPSKSAFPCLRNGRAPCAGAPVDRVVYACIVIATPMNVMPNARRAVISERKILEYLLDPDHPDGSPKAAFFAAMGYIPANWRALRRSLELVAYAGQVRAVTATGRPHVKNRWNYERAARRYGKTHDDLDYRHRQRHPSLCNGLSRGRTR